MLTSDERAALRANLLTTGISGDTRTTRENTVNNARLLSAGDPDKLLGLDHGKIEFREVMDAVAHLCGCSPDLNVSDGPGYIDPDRTLDELERYAARLQEAARRTETVLICTGHPTGPLALYMAVARALEDAGCKILRPLDGERFRGGEANKHRGNRLRFLDGVGVLADGASLYHTHEAWPMTRLLAACEPDLILADHGFAGAAIASGVETLAFNDINDPSIAVAKMRNMIDIVVPLDDNVPTPDSYSAITEFLVRSIRSR